MVSSPGCIPRKEKLFETSIFSAETYASLLNPLLLRQGDLTLTLDPDPDPCERFGSVGKEKVKHLPQF